MALSFWDGDDRSGIQLSYCQEKRQCKMREQYTSSGLCRDTTTEVCTACFVRDGAIYWYGTRDDIWISCADVPRSKAAC